MKKLFIFFLSLFALIGVATTISVGYLFWVKSDARNIWEVQQEGVGRTEGVGSQKRSKYVSVGQASIDRTWMSETGRAVALCTYCNNTNRTFTREVKLQAVAYNSAGTKLGMNERSLFARRDGYIIPPGFTRSVEIPVKIHGARMSRMTVHVTVAQ